MNFNLQMKEQGLKVRSEIQEQPSLEIVTINHIALKLRFFTGHLQGQVQQTAAQWLLICTSCLVLGTVCLAHRGQPKTGELRTAEAEALVMCPSQWKFIISPEWSVYFAQFVIPQDTLKSCVFLSQVFVGAGIEGLLKHVYVDGEVLLNTHTVALCAWKGANIFLGDIPNHISVPHHPIQVTCRADSICLPHTVPQEHGQVLELRTEPQGPPALLPGREKGMYRRPAVGRQSMTHRGVQQIFPIMHPGQRSGGSPLRHEVRETRMCCHKLVQGSDSSSPTEQLLTPLFW